MYFKDGSCYTNATYLLGHELDLDEAENDVNGKYNEIMSPRVGKKQAERIHAMICKLDEIKQISELCDLL